MEIQIQDKLLTINLNWIGQVICYLDLLLFDEFVWREKSCWLPSMNKVANEKRSKTKHCNLIKKICVPLKMQIFVSHFVLRRLQAKFFLANLKLQLTQSIQLRYTSTKIPCSLLLENLCLFG